MNLRSFRIFGLAVFDYVMTFIGAFLLHYYMWINANVKYKENRTNFQYYFSLFYIFIASLGIGTILHYFFNVSSTFSRYLGLND